MKKVILGLVILYCCVGCSSIKNESYESILNTTMNTTVSIVNTYRAGYNYYLPKGVRSLYKEGTNEIFAYNDNVYYLYVDRVSYYNKVIAEYEVNEDAFYSKALEKDDFFGYIEIKITENNQYFIEIMYNYAKIEVIVNEEDINEAISYAMIVLNSITYQDTVLESLLSSDSLKSSEVEHNIFESAETESGYLEIVEEYGQYEEDETVDPDFIR